MRRETAQDIRLSSQALGLLAYLMSKPDTWEPTVADIRRRFSDIGRNKAYEIINEELIPHGYARRVRETTEDGKVAKWITEIYEAPLPQNRELEAPDTEFREEEPVPESRDVEASSRKPVPENRELDINRVQNTEYKELSINKENTEVVVSRVKPRSTKRPTTCDEQFLVELQQDPAYSMLNVQHCYHRMVAWCRVNRQQPTRRRFINWLNREDRPMTAPTPQNGGSSGRYQVPSHRETHNERAARETAELFQRSLEAANGPDSTDTADSSAPWIAADFSRL